MERGVILSWTRRVQGKGLHVPRARRGQGVSLRRLDADAPLAAAAASASCYLYMFLIWPQVAGSTATGGQLAPAKVAT